MQYLLCMLNDPCVMSNLHCIILSVFTDNSVYIVCFRFSQCVLKFSYGAVSCKITLVVLFQIFQDKNACIEMWLIISSVPYNFMMDSPI